MVLDVRAARQIRQTGKTDKEEKILDDSTESSLARHESQQTSCACTDSAPASVNAVKTF